MLVAFLLLIRVALAVPTVAIADLANDTGDSTYDPAGPGVAALLITRFSRTEAVRVVERSQLQQVIGEMQLGKSGLVDPATAAQAGRLLGARYIVMGSLFSVKLPMLAASLRVVDTETGAIVAAEEVSGDIGPSGEKLFVLVDQLAAKMVAALKLELSDSDRIELSQVDIRELEALLKYGRKISAPPQDKPKAIWRDKARDMMQEPERNVWVVYNNEGSRYTTNAFAKAVGDDAVLAKMDLEAAAARAQGTRGSAVGFIITGVGVAASAASFAVQDPRARIGLLGVGGATAAAGLTWAWGAAIRRGSTLATLENPGHWWTPEQADALIDTHNAELP